MLEGRWPRRVTPRPRSGAAAKSARLRPRLRGQGRRPRGLKPRRRPGAAAGRSNPTSKERWLRAQEGLEEVLFHVQGLFHYPLLNIFLVDYFIGFS